MATIGLNNLNLEFRNRNGSRLKVLEQISIEFPNGSISAIFGPNACGKTTLIKIISGLESGYSGIVKFDGIDKSKKISLVPQNPMDHLLPWKSVVDNIRFYLEAKNWNKLFIDERISILLENFDLTSHIDHYPYQLSGGLRQKLALACAISFQPEVLLLDEPFSALDYSASIEIALMVRKQWEKDRQTTICICHHPDHCLLIGDKVIVLSPAPAKVVAQIDVPHYNRSTFDLFLEKSLLQVRTNIIENFKRGL